MNQPKTARQCKSPVAKSSSVPPVFAPLEYTVSSVGRWRLAQGPQLYHDVTSPTHYVSLAVGVLASTRQVSEIPISITVGLSLHSRVYDFHEDCTCGWT